MRTHQTIPMDPSQHQASRSPDTMQKEEAPAAALPPKKRKLLQCASAEAADEAARSRREQRLEMNRHAARIRRRRKQELIEELQNAMSELTRKNAALRERNKVLRAELGGLGPEEPESAAKAADGNAASTDPLASTLLEAESQCRKGGEAKDPPSARAAAFDLPRTAPQREQSQRHAMPLVAALRIGGRAASAEPLVATGIGSSCHVAQRAMAGGSIHRHSAAGAVAAPSPPQGGGDAALRAQLPLTRMLSMGTPVAVAAPTMPSFPLNPEQTILATRLLAAGRQPQQQQQQQLQQLQDPQRAYAAAAAATTAELSRAGAQQQPEVAAAAATTSAQIQSAASAAANDLLRRRTGSVGKGGAFGSAVLRLPASAAAEGYWGASYKQT